MKEQFHSVHIVRLRNGTIEKLQDDVCNHVEKRATSLIGGELERSSAMRELQKKGGQNFERIEQFCHSLSSQK